MKSFWLKFEDGSQACCDGENAYDAVRIAEHLSGKKVDIDAANQYKPEESDSVNLLPYPANPRIWAYEHPVNGACPPFCYDPRKCKGNSSCNKSPACSS